MNVYQAVQIACLSIVLLCCPVIVFYLRKARKYSRITAKLLSGEALTEREQRALDELDAP